MAEIRDRVSRSEDEVLPKTLPSSGQSIDVGQLSSQANSYTITSGPPKTITFHNASKLSLLQQVSVTGTLLPKQFIALDPKTGRRTVSRNPDGYKINPSDGDLHLDLGQIPMQPHITCELQRAKPFLSTFKSAIGKTVTIGGFFRCLFEHPGFAPDDDAHIFEIHPVTTVTISGKTNKFDVGIPDQQSIHSWTSPHKLNDQDQRIKVHYDTSNDALTFSGMDGSDENYVRVSGAISQVQLNNIGGQSNFVLTSKEIGHSIRVLCLEGSKARRQLTALKSSRINLVALRNIDLTHALKNKYMINLVGIDIQSA